MLRLLKKTIITGKSYIKCTTMTTCPILLFFWISLPFATLCITNSPHIWYDKHLATTNITTFPTFHLRSSSPSATADHSPTGGTTTNITTFPTFHLHSSSPSATADQSPTGGTTTSFDSNPSSVSIPTVHVQQPTNPRILSYSTSSSDTISSRPPILPTTRPTYAERLSALCSQSNAPFYNLFTLQHAIIELENTFFGLYQYRPEETSGWEYEEFQSFYDLTESDLKSKYRLLESMRTLDIYNPENTNLPYNPSCTYHIYNGRLKPIIYQRTHSPPHIHKSSQWGGQRGVLLEKNEPMLGDGYLQKKKALELKRGGRINIETPVPRNSHIPPPLSQLSDWVRLPSNTHGAHFTPYTAYSLTPSTCQIGFSYCCHNFCLPTQSHNAFTSPFPSTTMHAPKPNIAFFSSLTAKAQPCLPAYNTLPALTSTTYNPSTNPLAVWECSNCWRENFFVYLIIFVVHVINLGSLPTLVPLPVLFTMILTTLLMTILPQLLLIATQCLLNLTIHVKTRHCHGTLFLISPARNRNGVPCPALIFHNTYTLFLLYHFPLATCTSINICTPNPSLPSSPHPYLTLLEQHTLLTFFCNVHHHHQPSLRAIASTSRPPSYPTPPTHLHHKLQHILHTSRYMLALLFFSYTNTSALFALPLLFILHSCITPLLHNLMQTYTLP